MSTQATATVTATIKVTLNSSWSGPTTIEQISKQAKDGAIVSINRHFANTNCWLVPDSVKATIHLEDI